MENFGMILQFAVNLSNRTASWGEYIGNRLGRFDGANGRSAIKVCANLRQIKIYDVTELAYGEGGNA